TVLFSEEGFEMKKVTLSIFALSLVFLATGCGDSPDSVMKDSINLMKEANGIVEGIKSKEDAEKAKPKLEEIVTKMKKVADRAKKVGKLDKDKKEALLKKFSSEMAEVQKQDKKIEPSKEAMEVLKGPAMELGLAYLSVLSELGVGLEDLIPKK